MRQIYRHVILLFLVFNLAACSTISGWFESDDDDATAPAELTDIDETVNIKELWSVDVGNGQGEGFYRLRPAIRGDMIYAAAADGEIVAVNRLSGDTVWEAELETPLSGGVGVYEDTLLVGSSEGYVLRLDANSGEKLWSTPLRGEILSAPQSNGKVVVAQTYDGRLQGLDYETGAILWTYDSNVPVLTIRGTSTPIFNNNQVYAGFANGRVLAFNAQTGALLWEVPRAALKLNALSMWTAPWIWWAMSCSLSVTRAVSSVLMPRVAARSGNRRPRLSRVLHRDSATSTSRMKTAP